MDILVAHRGRKAHVSLTWAPRRNPLLVVRHTSLGAPLRGGTFQPGESGARWRGGGAGQLGKLTRWQGGWRPPHQGGCSLAWWLGGPPTYFPTLSRLSGLPSLTHTYTQERMYVQQTLFHKRNTHKHHQTHKNTLDRSSNMS